MFSMRNLIFLSASSLAVAASVNPLLNPWTGPYGGVPPFGQVKVKDFKPAIKQAILSIIFLDAAIALQFGGNLAGMVICGLAIPTLALSRVFRVT